MTKLLKTGSILSRVNQPITLVDPPSGQPLAGKNCVEGMHYRTGRRQKTSVFELISISADFRTGVDMIPPIWPDKSRVCVTNRSGVLLCCSPTTISNAKYDIKHRIPTLKDHPKHIRKDLRTLNNGFIQVCY